jgi:hypothetical protein
VFGDVCGYWRQATAVKDVCTRAPYSMRTDGGWYPSDDECVWIRPRFLTHTTEQPVQQQDKIEQLFESEHHQQCEDGRCFPTEHQCF